MKPTLEIAGRVWDAAAPWPICRGEGVGCLECLPPRDECKRFLEEWAGRCVPSRIRRIFICDRSSLALRPLIPSAAGFVFSEGSALGHFPRILRAQGVPACIDRRLWQQARLAALHSDEPLPARLDCGAPDFLPDQMRSNLCLQLQSYHRRLSGHDCRMPVYDATLGRVLPCGRAVDPAWGEKALAVNALMAENLPTADALLVIDPDARADVHSDPRFLALLEKTFPRFGRRADCELIVRVSLHSTSPSSIFTGLFKAPTVTSFGQLASTIENQMSQWRQLRHERSEINLTIIVQERVRAIASGLLTTGHPWDCSAKGLVCALTPLERERDAPASYQLLLNEHELLGQAPAELASWLPSRFEPVLPLAVGGSFGGRLGEFVVEATALSDRYAVPLELEFAMTDECEFRFVQFRPLSYVEQAGAIGAPAWRKNA